MGELTPVPFISSPAMYDETTSYQVDENDRLTREELDTTGDGVADKTTVYQYDPVAAPGTPGGAWTVLTRKTVYQGNSTVEINRREQTDHVYNDQGRMESSSVKQYATDGTTITDNDTSMYEYNDNGIRIRQKTSENGAPQKVREYLIDPRNHTGYAQILEEFVDSTLHHSFTLGHDVLTQANTAAVVEAANKIMHLVYDGHGSTRQLWDQAAASVIQRFAYDAYGNLLAGTGLTNDLTVALTSLLYSGEQTDRTGLQYLRARYYDPRTGRFNRLDPFAGNVRDPLGLHKYVYVHSDPANRIDPLGENAIYSTLRNLLVTIATAPISLFTFVVGAIGGSIIGARIASEFLYGETPTTAQQFQIDKALLTIRVFDPDWAKRHMSTDIEVFDFQGRSWGEINELSDEILLDPDTVSPNLHTYLAASVIVHEQAHIDQGIFRKTSFWLYELINGLGGEKDPVEYQAYETQSWFLRRLGVVGTADELKRDPRFSNSILNSEFIDNLAERFEVYDIPFPAISK